MSVTEGKLTKVMSWIDFGIFPGHCMLSSGRGYDEINTYLKGKKYSRTWLKGISEDKELIDGGNYFGLYRCIEDTKTKEETKLYYLILKPEFKFTDEEFCILAHEIVHICQFYLPDILDRNREIEAEAYLHTHLMRQCINVLRK